MTKQWAEKRARLVNCFLPEHRKPAFKIQIRSSVEFKIKNIIFIRLLMSVKRFPIYVNDFYQQISSKGRVS